MARPPERRIDRSSIHRSPADVRQAVYMLALVATRFNPDMTARYAHLIKTGKTRPDDDQAKAWCPSKPLLKANRPRR